MNFTVVMILVGAAAVGLGAAAFAVIVLAGALYDWSRRYLR